MFFTGLVLYSIAILTILPGNSAFAATFFWDTSGSANDSTFGGDGTWDGSNTFWNNSAINSSGTGSLTPWVGGTDIADFLRGTSGTISVSGTQILGGMNLGASAGSYTSGSGVSGTGTYVFNGGALDIRATNAGNAISVSSGTSTINSNILLFGATLGGNTALSNNFAYAGGLLTVNGNIIDTGGNGTHTLNLNQSSGNGPFAINGNITKVTGTTAGITLNIGGNPSGSTSGNLVQYVLGGTNSGLISASLNRGTLILNNSSALSGLSGALTVANSNTTVAAADTAIVLIGTAGVTINKAVTFTALTATDTSDIRTIGSNITSGTATYSGQITANAMAPSGTGASLSVTSATGGTVVFSNRIAGAAPLTITGGGTVSFSGTANTYTGPTTISAGTLNVAFLAVGGSNSSIGASTSAATNLVFNGGTLQYTGGSASTDRLFATGTNGGTIDASGSGAVSFTNTGAMDFNSQTGARTLALTGTNTGNNTLAVTVGDNSGATSLAKNGTGTWVLSGSNSYTGATSVTNGVLKVNGSLANTTVTVGNAGTAALTPTLGGGIGNANGGSLGLPGNTPTLQVYGSSASVGNIVGSVTISGTSASGSAGHLAPGNSVGTLTVGSLTLSGGSILDYEFNGSANDFTVVTGALSLNSGTAGINLYQEGTTTQFTAPGTYDLFQYGSLVGSVGNLSVLNPSGTNSYTFGTATVGGTNYVTLTIAPAVGATSTTYTLTAAANSVNILTGGTTGITSTITNTGSGSADTLNYSNLTATSGSGGNVTGSPATGGPLAQGATGTNSGLVFHGTSSGAVTVTAVGSGTNATLNTAASQTGTNTVTVNVFDAASLSSSQSGTNFLANNASGSFRASAKITADNGLLNNQGFNNIAVTLGTQIDSGTSIIVAGFDSTGKLNGTYTATKSLGYDNVTSSGSAITGGTGNTANIGLTATVSGHAAAAGQVFGAPVFSSQAYGTTTPGGSSSGYGLTSNIGSDSHSPTTATIIGGNASAATTLLMSFDKVPAGSEPDNAFRVSDILTLSGLVKTGGTGHDNSTLTDIYVLQLTYDSTATGQKFIGWYDAAQNQWVNAVAGNSTGGPYDGTGEYIGSYASYLASLSLSDQTNLSAQLGAFGYDPTTETAWAVVNHESEFAVIPEPGTWGMIISGFGMLIGIQKLRRRRVGT